MATQLGSTARVREKSRPSKKGGSPSSKRPLENGSTRRYAVDADRDGAVAVSGDAVTGLPGPHVCRPIKLAAIPGSTSLAITSDSAFARTRHVRRVFCENTVLVAGSPRLPGSTPPLDLRAGNLKLNQPLSASRAIGRHSSRQCDCPADRSLGGHMSDEPTQEAPEKRCVRNQGNRFKQSLPNECRSWREHFRHTGATFGPSYRITMTSTLILLPRIALMTSCSESKTRAAPMKRRSLIPEVFAMQPSGAR